MVAVARSAASADPAPARASRLQVMGISYRAVLEVLKVRGVLKVLVLKVPGVLEVLELGVLGC